MRCRLRRADGVYRWMSSRAEPMRDRTGGIVHWYGICHDIDDQMHAEEALRRGREALQKSERLLRQLVETLPAMIDCAASDGEPIYRSRRLSEFLGYDLEDLDGTGKSRLAETLDAGVHPDDVAGVKEAYGHSLATGEPYLLVGRALAHSFATGETFAMKYRHRRADGAYRWVNTRAEPLRDATGRIIQWYGVMFDIDDEVRAQEELRLTQERLAVASQVASLAELSASIAHEVNQPLAAVVAYSHACHRWLSSEPPNLDRARVTVERIIRSANSAADVVSRIRALFRPTAKARTLSSLDALIAEVGDLVSDDLRKQRVTLDTTIEPGIPDIAFDRVQIQQVLVNLIRNAAEAMEGVTGARVLTLRARKEGAAAAVEVSDCGVGIDSAEKIFEPFFTTKENGMGMGLAICRSIVESHGGRLWVEKRAPQGATFLFTLPIVESN